MLRNGGSMVKPWIVLLIAVNANCVVGDEDSANADDAAQEATNRPYKNGCDSRLSVLSCATIKGVDPSWACGFRERREGAMFKLVARGTTDNADWQAENLIPRLPAASTGYYDVASAQYGTRGATPLGTLCNYIESNGLTRNWDITMIPTAAGCKKLAGRWDGRYCY